MSISERIEIRDAYIQAWYKMDAEILIATCADEFVFDDPAEPAPVTRDGLVSYIQRWDQRTRALGSDNQWRLSHEIREDKDGVLTDWEWWELLGTNLQGSAMVQTIDDGVLLERITYFDRIANSG